MSSQSEYLDVESAPREAAAHVEPILRRDARRVLVMLMDHHLGNLVISLPIAQALTEYFEQPVDLLVDARWAELANRLPNVGQLHHYPAQCKGRRGYLRNGGRLGALWGALLRRRYDAVIDATGNIRSTSWCMAVGCRTRIGLADARRAWLYSHRLDPAHGPHTYDRYAALLRCIGRTDRPEPITLNADAESHRRVADELDLALGRQWSQGPLVVMHPSAGKTYRRWPRERFAAVADGLIERAGARVAIIGTNQERELGEAVRQRMRRPEAAAYLALPVIDLLALFERASVIVSNESGPTHLAATTDLPIVTIFGPTPEPIWRPLRQRDTVMLRGAMCDPACGRRVCVAEHRCLMELEAEQVLEHALEAIESRKPAKVG